MKKSFAAVVCILFLGLIAVNANASVITVTSFPTFLTYVPSPIVENFEDNVLQPTLSIVEVGGAGSIHDGVYENIVDKDVAGGRYQIFTFSGPIYGFGAWLDLAGPGGPGSNIEVSLPELSYVVGQVPNTYAGEFWGFYSTVPFTQVMFSEGSEVQQETYFVIDLAYSQPVPIPAAVWLLGSGLIGLVGLRRKFNA